MKNLFGYFGSRRAGGFLIILPILLTCLLVGQMFDGLLVLTTPIVDVMPETLFSDALIHRMTAAAILLVLCLFIGLVMGTAIGQIVGSWIENRFLLAFPPYRVIRNLSQSLSDRDGPAKLRPALIVDAPDKRSVDFIIEEHASREFTVFIPLAPTATVFIVGPARVQKLDSLMKEAIGCVMNWGSGCEWVIRTTGDTKNESLQAGTGAGHHV